MNIGKEPLTERPFISRIAGEVDSENRIIGPLGIWNFPILNLIIKLIETFRERVNSTVEKREKSYRNIEEWEIWEEPSGKLRIRVHRRAVKNE